MDHNQAQKRYWDSVAADNRVPEDARLPFPAIRERDLFFKFGGFKKGDEILEIGCGTGRYTLNLLRMGCRVQATDISERSLDVLKETAKKLNLDENLSIEVNSFDNAEKCKKFLGRFDYAIFIAVIHHLDPASNARVINNAVSSLKKGGKVVALEPNPWNPLYYFLYAWRAVARIKGKNRWGTEKDFLRTSAFGLLKLFRGSGLEGIEIKRYAWFPSRFGNHCRVVLGVNDILNKIPFIKEASAFIWIKAERKD